MKKSVLVALWAALFILCAGLGFLPEQEGVGRTLLTAVSVLCFAPPALLLRQAKKDSDAHTIRLIRNLSLLSLALTMAALILNFLSVAAGELAGLILYYVLIIVSSPMVCSGYWALILFLWACLLVSSRQLLNAK